MFLVLVVCLATSVAPAADAVWPENSAGDFSIFVTLQRFRIYADHCSARVPQLKPKFDSLMESLDSQIQGIAKRLIGSDAFRDMKDKPVPAEIIFAFKDSLDDMRHNFERTDADTSCPKTLQNLGKMDEESLTPGLRDILATVQNMIRNLE